MLSLKSNIGARLSELVADVVKHNVPEIVIYQTAHSHARSHARCVGTQRDVGEWTTVGSVLEQVINLFYSFTHQMFFKKLHNAQYQREEKK